MLMEKATLLREKAFVAKPLQGPGITKAYCISKENLYKAPESVKLNGSRKKTFTRCQNQ